MRHTRTRLIAPLTLVLALSAPAWAQSTLTDAQMLTVKAHIVADPVLNAEPQTGVGDAVIAAALNAPASPSFTVWKTQVTINAVGKSFDGSELSGLTSLNHTRLQTLAVYLASGVNPSQVSNRQFFDDIFSGAGGANTRASLLGLWKRLTTRLEKLLATGTGSDAVPGLLTFEGNISPATVNTVRNR